MSAASFWWNKYIGIPFADNSSDIAGSDCWGLVKMVYREQLGIDLPGPLGISADDRDRSAAAIRAQAEALWERTNNPQPGDVALFRVAGYDSHVGLAAAPGMILHVRQGRDSVIEPLCARTFGTSFRGYWHYAGMRKLAGLAPESGGVRVIGRPHPFEAAKVDAVAATGQSVTDIIDAYCDEAGVPHPLRTGGHVYIGGRYIPFEAWGETFPAPGSVLYFSIYPRGSGLKIFASIAVMALAALATWYVGGLGVFAAGGALAGWGGVAGGIAGLAVMTLGTFAMGALFPAPKPKLSGGGGGSSAEQLHFLSGSQNTLRPYKPVPQVLGIGRMTLDYYGKPYTERASEKTNFLRAAYCGGYGPVEISDVRNGDTLLSSYVGAEVEVYQGLPTDPGPRLYTKDVTETGLNIELKKADGWHYFTTGDNVDQVGLEFYWPNGLYGTSTKSGKPVNAYSYAQIQMRQLPTGAFSDVQKAVAARSFDLPSCSPFIETTYIYDESGNLNPDDFWLSTYGVPKKSTAQYEEIDLWQWHVISIDKNNRLLLRTGTVTDNKNAEPSARLLTLMARGKYQWNTTVYNERIPGLGDNEEALYQVCVKGDSVVEVKDLRDAAQVTGCDYTIINRLFYVEAGTIDRGEADTFQYKMSNTKNPFTREFTYNVSHGQYEIRVRRSSNDYAGDVNTYPQFNTTIWRAVREITAGKPFDPPVPLARVECRIQSTNQLNGTLDNINALVKSIVPDYNYKTKSWISRAANNPASLYRRVLQGPANPKPLPDAEIDIPTLERWHNYCRTQGFTYFRVVGGDDGMSTFELLTEIAAAGNAKPDFRDGKWTVVIDEPRTVVTQHFIQHNSWGFTGSKTFIDLPHAIRAHFVNEEKGYEQDIVTVYADGYGPSNATKFEEWPLDRCMGYTNPKHVIWKVWHAMYWAQLRPETYKLNTDIEHIICSYGDLVRVTHDVPMWGLGSGRVREPVMSGGVCVGAVLDTPVNMLPGERYSMRFRLGKQSGKSSKRELAVVQAHEEYTEVRFTSGSRTDIPQPGDLFQFGKLDEESKELLVSYLRPDGDGNAEIHMIDYAPEIYGDLDKPIPDFVSGITEPEPLPRTIIESVPTLLDAYSDDRALIRDSSGNIISRIGVVFGPPLREEIQVSQMQLRYAILQEAEEHPGDEEEPGPPEYGEWLSAPLTPVSSGTAYISPAVDGGVYRVDARFVADDGSCGAWARLLDDYTALGKTAPPPDVTGFTAAIVDASGVTLAWDASPALDHDYYRVGGAADIVTQDTRAVAQVYKRTGTLQFNCVDVDTSGLASAEPATASVTVNPPARPVLAARPGVGGALLRWQNCTRTWPIAAYTVIDTDVGDVHTLNALETALTPRIAGKYLVEAYATDVYENTGAIGQGAITVTPPENPVPAMRVDGADLVISWAMVTSFFPVDYYEVYTVAWSFVQKDKANQVRFPAVGVGEQEYRVRAVDVAGNASAWVEVHLELLPPAVPLVDIVINDNRDGMIASWRDGGSMLPIVAWDVVRQWDVDLGGGVVETREEDLGRLDVDSLMLPPVTVGEHFYLVRAIDSAGNKSLWGETVFTAQPPGQVQFYGSTAIDNNFLLYWTEPTYRFYAIAYYLFSQIDPDGYEMEIGRIDALFASAFESVAGEYRYRIRPVDVAGNMGTSADIVMRISQPPDFILYHDYDSLFNGVKTNMALDGAGAMFGPVPVDETWQGNIERSAAALSVAGDTLTWADKIAGGHGYYLSPYLAEGRYTEVVDVGTLLPSSKISVTVSSKALEGTPILTCGIEISQDGADWIPLTDNSLEVYAANFRYVRYTFTITGGLLQITNINYNLNIKRLTDFGTAYCAAGDNGPGWPDDAEQSGTEVFFTVGFTDVSGVPVCTVVNNSPDNPLTAFTIFKDVLNPKSFRVFVLGKNGERTSATVSWFAQGV